MLILGLTGGIATGKGVVASTWSQAPGVRVVDADPLVHALYRRESPIHQQLVEAFGPTILDGEGGINRKALGKLVFQDESARRTLNTIVHPAVRAQYARLAQEALAQGVAVFVVEAALLLDSQPDHSFFNAFVTTDLDEQEQLRRLMARDGLSSEAALSRIRAQLPRALRRKRADYALDTSGSMEQTQARARELLARIERELG